MTGAAAAGERSDQSQQIPGVTLNLITFSKVLKNKD